MPARSGDFCEAIVRAEPELGDDEVLDRAEAVLAALNGYAFQWLPTRAST